ncbi:MAG TPA: carbon-nitrogen hydrolase family protein [Kiloniellaceae bacterium]|nr:carbon-nitrogen hydrolase family protein [Kiloniellaceae bacterium]
MTPFAIAGIQMHVAALRENVSAMRHQVDLLMSRFPWTQMVVFSELAPYGPLPEFAKPLPSPAEAAFQEMAARHGIWLLPGSMFEQRGDAVYNTASVIDPQGRVVGRYSKMFPFKPFEVGIASGVEPLVFDVPAVGRFGVSICYDIWFPETTRLLTSLGAEVLLHPVLTGTIDRDVELSIARATSAMFQCYVFDINGVGAGSLGRSAVFDPAGVCLHQASVGEEMIPVEIDMDQVRRQRAVGMNGLGQPLKSFRDRAAEFSIYDRDRPMTPYLQQLGPLEMPARGGRGGLDGSLVPQDMGLGADVLSQEAAVYLEGEDMAGR